MDTPLVSVILATYNGSQFLSDAISSVLSQDYQNLELIIIDDGSTDKKVYEIIQVFQSQDERIRYELNPRNMERSWSKNRGVELAKGDYIAFIDDDDIWEKTKLSEQMNLMGQDGEIGIVGTFARFIDDSGNLLSETNHLKVTKQDIHNSILFSNQFIQSSILLRKEVFFQAGGFPDFNLCEDYDLWLRVLQISQGRNVSMPLVQYRVRHASTTTKNLYRMKWMTVKLVWKYRKNFPNAIGAILLKGATFPLNISVLLKLWNSIFGKKSRL